MDDETVTFTEYYAVAKDGSVWMSRNGKDWEPCTHVLPIKLEPLRYRQFAG